MFDIGQKVVCVDDHFCPVAQSLYMSLPVAGSVYMVKTVKPGRSIAGEAGEVAITLVELANPCGPRPPYHELAFSAFRFRAAEEADAAFYKASAASVKESYA